jgi:hypothetical protein
LVGCNQKNFNTKNATKKLIGGSLVERPISTPVGYQLVEFSDHPTSTN